MLSKFAALKINEKPEPAAQSKVVNTKGYSISKIICVEFQLMSLREQLLEGIFHCGLKSPSPLQQRVVIPCSKGLDVIVSAKSRSGKTIAYSIGLLQQLDTTSNDCQALMIVHEHLQGKHIQGIIQNLGVFLRVSAATCTDGGDLPCASAHVLIGTPDCILDLVRRKTVRVEKLKCFVIDDLNKVAAKGFMQCIEDLFIRVGIQCEKMQVMVFGTELTKEMLSFCENKMTQNPVKVLE